MGTSAVVVAAEKDVVRMLGTGPLKHLWPGAVAQAALPTLRWLWLACRTARALADDGAWDELTARHLDLARRAGAFSALPVALTDRVLVELFSGRTGMAISLAAESDAVVEATGSYLTLRASIVLANWRAPVAATGADVPVLPLRALRLRVSVSV
jgi:hypothetical protein